MSPKRSEHFKADRREEILAAAVRCFLDHGYDRTTLREIAAAAGVSTGAIYVYFRTKAAILEAVCAERTASERDRLRETLANLPPGMDPLTAGMAAIFQPHLHVALEERRQRERLDLMMLYEATRDPEFAGSLRENLQSWRALALTLVREEQGRGRIAADVDAEALVNILMALPHGLEVNELLGGWTVDWPAVIRTLTRVVWPGLRAAPVVPGAEPGENAIGLPDG